MTTVREDGKVYTADNVYLGLLIPRGALTVAEDRSGDARTWGTREQAIAWLKLRHDLAETKDME